MTPPRRAALASVALTALTFSGCGFLGSPTKPVAPAPEASQSAGADPAVAATPTSTPKAPRPAGVPDLGDPIATLDHDNGKGFTATLDVYPIQTVNGSTVQVWAHLTTDSTGADSRVNRILYANTTNGNDSLPDGFVLIDSPNREIHRPMLDDSGKPVCAPMLLGMSPGDEAWVSCMFSKPKSPQITIDIVNFGSVSNASIQ